jgi:hypothetical protein
VLWRTSRLAGRDLFHDERVRDRFVEVWGVGGGIGFGPAGTGRVYWYCFEAVLDGLTEGSTKRATLDGP